MEILNKKNAALVRLNAGATVKQVAVELDLPLAQVRRIRSRAGFDGSREKRFLDPPWLERAKELLRENDRPRILEALDHADSVVCDTDDEVVRIEFSGRTKTYWSSLCGEGNANVLCLAFSEAWGSPVSVCLEHGSGFVLISPERKRVQQAEVPDLRPQLAAALSLLRDVKEMLEKPIDKETRKLFAKRLAQIESDVEVKNGSLV